MIKVVTALIEKDNKILIAKRSTGDLNVLGKWEFSCSKCGSTWYVDNNGEYINE